jgi:hypothetical protein
MTMSVLDHLIHCQSRLLSALDARDADAIGQATTALYHAIDGVEAEGAWTEATTTRAQVDHAIKQTEAARIRVNILTDWTRRRIARLSELRGLTAPFTYKNSQKSGSTLRPL